MNYRILLALALATSLQSADWKPIPPEIWAMKEEPSQGVKGAIVLEQSLSFTPMAILHTYKVRILSESGRSSAELIGVLPESMEFEGRTIYRDGNVVTFNKRKDFHEKTETRPGYQDRVVKVLLPPGVTSDCVVELRWADKIDFQNHRMGSNQWGKSGILPRSLGYSAEWALGGPFKVLHSTVEIPAGFPWTITVTPMKGKPLDVIESMGKRTFTFRDIPAWENPPFSAMSLADMPRCNVWYQPSELGGKFANRAQDYWDTAADSYMKRFFETDLVSGKNVEALAMELTKDLQSDPFEKASTLLMRLERRIRNISMRTLEEAAEMTSEEEKSRIESDDLEAAVARGYTNGWGMARLYFALARKAGLEPVLAMVKDRSQSLLRYQRPDIHQFSSWLVGVHAPQRQTLWLDPTIRYLAPGLILPAYQGTDAILVEPGFPKWKARQFVIPIQPAQWNASSFDYQMTIGAGKTTFSMKAAFSGYDEFVERRRFLTLEPSEQSRLLKDHLEKEIADSIVHQAKVQNAQNPDQNVQWEASGEREVETSASVAIDPFPGMSSPLPLPQSWPERRADTILLDHLSSRTARCRFVIPDGYTIVPQMAFAKANGFGKVSWEWGIVKGSGIPQIEIRLRVEASKLVAPPEAYAELKQFMEWIRDALSRKVLLTRASHP